jgi:hypothetical protein
MEIFCLKVLIPACFPFTGVRYLRNSILVFHPTRVLNRVPVLCGGGVFDFPKSKTPFYIARFLGQMIDTYFTVGIAGLSQGNAPYPALQPLYTKRL